MCLNEFYKLMESLFSNLEFIFEFWPKTENYSNEQQGLNIDQITVCYISMDSFQRALQTNGKLFFQILNYF